MKSRSRRIGMSALAVALLTTITLLNRCLDVEDKSIVIRDMDEQHLNRKLTMVHVIFHALGLLYNE